MRKVTKQVMAVGIAIALAATSVPMSTQTVSAAKKTAAPRTSSRTAKSKFNNFEGRKYQDMDELTRKLIETR